jgi:hypothetical protein
MSNDPIILNTIKAYFERNGIYETRCKDIRAYLSEHLPSTMQAPSEFVI